MSTAERADAAFLEAPPIAGLSESPMTAPQAVVAQILIGPWVAQPIYVLATLGIADELREGPRTVEELAEATGSHAPSLYRVLRLAAMFGVFAETEDGRFELTPPAHALRTDVPGSLVGLARWVGEDWHWRPWGQLLHTVKTGEQAFAKVHGKTIWDYLEEDRSAAETFNFAMAGHAIQNHSTIIPAYDFSGIDTLCDVGGGEGALLALILEHNPDLKGIVYDQPSVVETTRTRIAEAGLEDRMEAIGGSFFDSVPAGADAYMLTLIVHDWSDPEAIELLRNIRAVIPDDGCLLVLENVIPPGNEFGYGKVVDVEQLVAFSGRERTEEEYRALFEAAGFTLDRIVPTAGPSSVLEGRPS